MIYRARVRPGKGRGKRINFPTLNLRIPERFPYQHGIYAGWVCIGVTRYMAAFHFGPIPSFGEPDISLEAFLIDTQLKRTPPAVTFELMAYLREIRAFPTVAALVRQIEKDVASTRAMLAHNQKPPPHTRRSG